MQKPAASSPTLTRRAVLKHGLAGILAYAVAPNFFPSSLFGRSAPSNRITLGIIGNGLIASEHIGSLLERDACRIIAVCDVWRRKAVSARDRIAKSYGDQGSGEPAKGIDIYSHYEDLLARPDIDAVFVCTPDHWHAPISCAAMIAGKDVYCEKPLTLTVAEGRTLVNTAQRTGRILQTGTQQRSNVSFRKAAEIVRNGMIGKLKVVRTRLGSDFPLPMALPEEPIPSDLDYDRWLGPTPWRPYNEQRIRGSYSGGWRCYTEYGARKIGDWGAHHYDIIQWALGMDRSGPVEFFPGDDKGAPQAFVYGNGVRVERIETNMPHMIQFIGTEGTVGVSRGDEFATQPADLTTRPLRGEQVHLYASDDHEADFLACVRSRQQPIAPAETGHRSATVCHLSAISVKLGRPIRWDPATEQIINDPVASRLLDRPRRSPYLM